MIRRSKVTRMESQGGPLGKGEFGDKRKHILGIPDPSVMPGEQLAKGGSGGYCRKAELTISLLTRAGTDPRKQEHRCVSPRNEKNIEIRQFSIFSSINLNPKQGMILLIIVIVIIILLLSTYLSYLSKKQAFFMWGNLCEHRI